MSGLMTLLKPSWWLLAAALLLPAAGSAGDSLRCGSRLVTQGDLLVQVQATCGEPDWRMRFPLPVAPGYAAADSVELWAYNHGSRRLLQILSFRSGRLDRIDVDGYGFILPARPACDPRYPAPGMSQFRLQAMCGEPIAREALPLFVPAYPQRDPWGYARPQRAVWRETWVYDFGPRQLLREVTLENGWVTDVQHGERGRGS